jgi:hypothetical protein
LVGAALGAALVAIGRVVGGPSRRVAAIGAVCWGLLAGFGQDYIGHRYRLRQYDDELQQNPLAAALVADGPLRPTFADHLRGKLQGDPAWWTLDLALTAAAAGLVVTAATHKRSVTKTLSPDEKGPSQSLSPGGRGQGEGD